MSSIICFITYNRVKVNVSQFIVPPSLTASLYCPMSAVGCPFLLRPSNWIISYLPSLFMRMRYDGGDIDMKMMDTSMALVVYVYLSSLFVLASFFFVNE